MAGIQVDVEGAREIAFALDRKLNAVRAGLEAGVNAAMSSAHRDMADFLRVYTHPMRTRTPSPPGSPPALVTGSLVRSIREAGPAWESTMTVVGSIGPTMVYARIQELGGRAGRGHATVLPARPYVAPTADLARVEAPRIIREHVAEALRTG